MATDISKLSVVLGGNIAGLQSSMQQGSQAVNKFVSSTNTRKGIFTGLEAEARTAGGRSGESFMQSLNEKLGRHSSLGMGLHMLEGAGAIAGVGLAAKLFEDMGAAAKKAAIDIGTGKQSVSGALGELVDHIPVIGGLIKGFEDFVSVIDGTAVAEARAAEAAKKLAEANESLAKAGTIRDHHVEQSQGAQKSLKWDIAIAALGSDSPDKSLFEISRKMDERIAAIRERAQDAIREIDAQKNMGRDERTWDENQVQANANAEYAAVRKLARLEKETHAIDQQKKATEEAAKEQERWAEATAKAHENAARAETKEAEEAQRSLDKLADGWRKKAMMLPDFSKHAPQTAALERRFTSGFSSPEADNWKKAQSVWEKQQRTAETIAKNTAALVGELGTVVSIGG